VTSRPFLRVCVRARARTPPDPSGAFRVLKRTFIELPPRSPVWSGGEADDRAQVARSFRHFGCDGRGVGGKLGGEGAPGAAPLVRGGRAPAPAGRYARPRVPETGTAAADEQ